MFTVDDIRSRLRAAETSMPRARIAQLSGVNRHWLEKFSQGVIVNPGFRNLQLLATWLEAQPADSAQAA